MSNKIITPCVFLAGLAACQAYPFVPVPPGATSFNIITGGAITAGASTGETGGTGSAGTTQTGGSSTGGQTAGAGTTSGTTGGTTTLETFTVSTLASTDILFVIDSSGSMADKQERLADNAQQFIDTLVASGDSFRIGIVSTDMIDPLEQGRLHAFAPGVLYLDAPAANDPNAAADGQLLIDRFVTAVKAVGTLGDSRESAQATALQALGVAEVEDPSVAAANANFLRPAADLAVVIVTDEDDCSRTAAGLVGSSLTSWTAEQCYDPNLEPLRLTPATVVQQLAKVKNGDLSRVRLGMIVAGVPGSDGAFNPVSCYTNVQSPNSVCGCWSRSGTDSATANWYCEINNLNGQQCTLGSAPACDPATSCYLPSNSCVTQCSAMGGHRYYNTLKALTSARLAQGASPGTAVGSICDASFSDSLSNIASQVVAPSCFKLAVTTDPNTTYAVTISGTGIPTVPIPELNPAHPGACTTCGGACGAGSWTVAGQTICLGCGLFLQPGERLNVSITTGSH